MTGGARGIGFAIARAFLDQGARVVILDRDPATAEAAVERLAARGEVTHRTLDVTDRQAFIDTVAEIEETLGPVHVLVNNAGIMPIGPVLEESEATSRRQMDVNFFGVLNGLHAVVPPMLRRNQGHVVNIASIAGVVGTPWVGVYSGTKHAVMGLTEAIRFEHRDTALHFGVVLPALVDTELVSGTGRPRFPPLSSPDDVARGVLRCIRERKVAVFVPRIGKFTTIVPGLLPRRLVDWIGIQIGIADMFSRVDPHGRTAYRERILGADAPPTESE